jgi:hypothetical protein
MSQLSFDIDAMIHDAEVAAAPTWAGVPLAYTSDYYTAAQLDEAFARYVFENGSFACIPRSHMWHRNGWDRGHSIQFGPHRIELFGADTSCTEADHHHSPGELPEGGGSRISHQAVCADQCAWHAIGTEREVVEAWHDHAMPGWRELPTLPDKLRPSGAGISTKNTAAMAWIHENYPEQWQQPGAPILTRRARYGTRHVPGYSPFGGYDLCVAVTEEGPE